MIHDEQSLKAAMARVSFEHSCLDMAWTWETAEVLGFRKAAFPGVLFRTGWNIRCSFQRPERTTGNLGRGFGRWWLIEDGASVSGLHKTMFAAAKMIVDHELMEAFKVDGRRPFDPHRSVEHLIATAEGER